MRLQKHSSRAVLKNFAKFTGKHLCQSLFFNKVTVLACNFTKKEALAQMFSCEFCEIFKNTFFYRKPLVAASAFNSLYKIRCEDEKTKLNEITRVKPDLQKKKTYSKSLLASCIHENTII